MKKYILHVSRSDLNVAGGLENFIKGLIDFQEKSSNLRIIHLKVRKIIDYYHLLIFLIKNKIDQIYIHDPQIVYLVLPLLMLKKISNLLDGVNLKLVTHGLFFHNTSGFTGGLKVKYGQKILKFCSFLDINYCTSQHDSECLLNAGVSNIKTIGNGFIKPIESGIRKRKSLIVMVARDAPNKNIDEFIEIASKCLVNRKFILICKAPKISTVEKCMRAGVTVLRDIGDKALEDIYRESLIIISTSKYEGFGRTLIEGGFYGAYPIYRSNPGHDFINSTIKSLRGEEFGYMYRFVEDVIKFINRVDLDTYCESRQELTAALCEVFLWENLLV